MAKLVIEDIGAELGYKNRPAAPRGLSRLAPVTCSTSIVCANCSDPFGGLTYDPETDTFHHRLDSECWIKSRQSRR